METKKEQNKRLCEKYPFLIPSNRWSGKRITEAQDGGYWLGSPDDVPEYDYEYTELDYMPTGWRIAFGEQLCEELKHVLEEDGLMDEYRITQIKEKYGTLRWYDSYGSAKTDAVLRKYEAMSRHICINCGKPAEFVTSNWISPYCVDCCPVNDRILPIEEWLSGFEDYAREDDGG